MNVLVVMPCHGRVKKTVALWPRLLQTAGMEAIWVAVADGDGACWDALVEVKGIQVMNNVRSMGYWHCMSQAAQRYAQADTLIVNIANDVLPGLHWLKDGVAAYQERFPIGGGVMGFIDGVQKGNQVPHFIAGAELLRSWYGDDYYPLMYRHSFADTEVCVRAAEAGRYAIARFAVLYHNHLLTGAPDDATYKLGSSTWEADQQTFMNRMRKWQQAH